MAKRAASSKAARPPHYDVLIIGGGINGAGIARDAAGRGFSVCLCERADFAGGTSSASTKLIHGGLRYLEHYEFRLVRESLMERETLWAMAPHIISPMRFVLPHRAGVRPAWLLRLGLFVYDHLGGRKLLPGTRTLDLTADEAGAPLKPGFRRAFEYSDCWVDDSRLVIANLQDAAALGARIKPRTQATRARYEDGRWHVDLTDTRSGVVAQATASVVINAAGPWVDQVLGEVFGRNDAANVRLVRGSHIVVKAKFDHARAYMMQGRDERVVFAIPYEDDYTLMGTTDVEHGDDIGRPGISHTEIDYILALANEYFAEPVGEDDIVWTYSGVRPLYDDGASKAQEATRDYVIRPDEAVGEGRLLNIFGGKITTYRRLAEAMLERIEAILGKRGAAWTRGAALPGGDFAPSGRDDLVNAYLQRFGFVDPLVMKRWVRQYGTRTLTLLGKAATKADLGRDFGAGLFEAELRYLMDHEWAIEADDVVFRRTKLGIRLSAGQRRAVGRWMEARAKSGATKPAA